MMLRHLIHPEELRCNGRGNVSQLRKTKLTDTKWDVVRTQQCFPLGLASNGKQCVLSVEAGGTGTFQKRRALSSYADNSVLLMVTDYRAGLEQVYLVINLHFT